MNQTYYEHTMDFICGIGLTFWACLLTLLIVLICGVVVKWLLSSLGQKMYNWYWTVVGIIAVYLCTQVGLAGAGVTLALSWMQ